MPTIHTLSHTHTHTHPHTHTHTHCVLGLKIQRPFQKFTYKDIVYCLQHRGSFILALDLGPAYIGSLLQNTCGFRTHHGFNWNMIKAMNSRVSAVGTHTDQRSCVNVTCDSHMTIKLLLLEEISMRSFVTRFSTQ